MPEARSVRSYCRTCIAACGVLVELAGDRVLRVKGDPDHPLSRGYTCPKGRAMGELQQHPDRLDDPMIRHRGGCEAVGWPEMMEDLAGRMASIRDEHGPGSIGFYLGTGGGYDSLGLFVFRSMQMAIPQQSTYSAMTIDTPCLPLVSSLMSGSMIPNPVLEIEDVRLTLMLGTNPISSHGHTTAWPNPTAMLRRLSQGGRELWVADVRETKTAQAATRYLPIRPSSDHALLAYLIRELLGPAGGANREHLAAHTMDVEKLEAAVASWTLDRAVDETGLPAADLEDLLASIRRHGRLALMTGTGCSMQRNANVIEWLSWSLQIITDSFEKPGGQWFHPGMSNRFELMPDFDEPLFRDAPLAASRPEIPGHVGETQCSSMIDEIESGNLRALFVLGGDPLTSFPDSARIEAALQKLEILAVADLVSNAMTEMASHVLSMRGPLERHDIPGYVESAQVAPVSQVTLPVCEQTPNRRPLWWVLSKLAESIGVKLLPKGVSADEADEESLLRSLVEGGRLDFDEILAAPAIVDDEVRTQMRGWVEKKLPQGRWRLAPQPIVEQFAAITAGPSSVERLRMVSGRQLRKMNSAFAKLAAPGERLERARVHLHAADAAEAGVEDGAKVRVTSSHGTLDGRAEIDPTLRRGAVWVPHGWAELKVGALLTGERGAIDPLTGMVTQTGVVVGIQPL
ncbi:MAG: molybdopterin-dependent oxidoreductase [bacterium]|nr:molybdopterin-dependent oxidoreductase [bacterium]